MIVCIATIVFSLALLGALPAGAVVGGSGPDTDATASPWAGAGAVIIGNSHYSGALISPRHVLTAAHVVSGRSPEKITFLVGTGDPDGVAIPARVLHIHPAFRGTQRGPDGVWHDDLAIIELAGPAPFMVPVYELYGQRPLPRSVIAFAGFGMAGDGNTGAHIPGTRHIRRIGYNRIDGLLADDDGSGTPEVFLFDFDGPDYRSNVFKPDNPVNASLGNAVEATFAGGDSGAPVFVRDRQGLKIVGVATFVAGGRQKGGFGSVGGGMLVSAYIDWIRSILNQPATAQAD